MALPYGSMPPTPGDWEAQRVRFSAGSAALIVLVLASTLIIRNVVAAAHQPMGWALAAATAALVLGSIAQWYGRVVRHGVAVLLTLLTVLLVVGVLAAGVVPELQREAARLSEILPEAAEGLEDHERYGQMARDLSLAERVTEAVGDLDDRVSAQAALEGAVGTVPSFVLTGILTAFFLLWGARFATGLERQVSDDDLRERARTVALAAQAKGRTYVLFTLGQSFALGAVIGLVAQAVGLPAPIALGLSVGVLSIIPFLGVILGSAPLLLVAAASEPGWTTVLLAVLVVGLQVGSAVFNQLVMQPRSLRVGPAPIVVGGLVAFEVYGFGGLAVALVLVVFGFALLDALPADETSPAPA
jgi:predicted PurR-regulated permease PerM